jgi:hypothetical protein
MFEITAEDVALLNDADLRALIGLLCEEEMRKRGFATSCVKWGGDQDASDGGLDVSVELPATTQIEGWVPRPVTGFQSKKQKMPRGEILEEMRPSGVVRPVIRELADCSGAYIIVSSESTSDQALRNRLNAMKEAVSDLANASALALDFYDRRRLATWVGDHPGRALWVRERIGKPLVGWRPYGAWADISEEVSGEYLSDDKLRIHTGMGSPAGLSALDGLKQIRALLGQAGKAARLVGLSGVGKTRLLQTLFEGPGDEKLSPSLAFYTNVPDSPDPPPANLASQLITMGRRAVLVVDNCPLDLHGRLSQVCRSAGSTVSVITVEYDIRDDLPEGTQVFRLDTSSPELIEKLIRRRFKDVSPTDAGTIAKFSDGNARVAIALAATVSRNETIEGLRDEDLIERLIQQRHAPDQSLSLAAQVCSLVYSFDGQDDGAGSELAQLGSLAGQSPQEMYRHVAELLRRGIVQKRGPWRAVLPHAIANRLAGTALQGVPSSAIQAHLVESAPERLLKSFSRRLGYLHASAEAMAIVTRWLEAGGILGNIVELNDVRKAMFDNVAPTAPGAAVSALERGMLPLGDAEKLRSCRRYVHVIRSLAYDAELFSRCTALLAKIAGAGDHYGESSLASRTITSLFQLCFSGTLAPIEQRLGVIEQLLLSDKAAEQTLGLKTLEAALEATLFGPFSDFEFGARSRDYGYWPRSGKEVKRWFRLTLNLGAVWACCDRPSVASQVRTVVARQLRGIWTVACAYDEIEGACRTISQNQFWPEGWVAVRETQYHDSQGLAPDVSERLESLEALLRPKDLVQRVQSIVLSDDYAGTCVTDIERDGADDVTERMARVNAVAQDLGKSVAADKRAFDELVSKLVGPPKPAAHLWPFGQGLARGAEDPRKTWNWLVDGLAVTPERQRNIQVLCGFLQALHEANPVLADALLDLAVQRDTAALWLPALQSAAGIDQRGVDRLMISLSLGVTPIENYRYLVAGGATDLIPADQLRDLILEIASKDGGFDVATDIFQMRLHHDHNKKQQDASEITDAGRELIRQVPFSTTQNNDLDYRLGAISKSCLRGEEGRAAADEIGRKLKGAVARHEAHAFYFNDLIGGLFEAQPTVTLDALCGGASQELASGFLMIRDLRQNPLDSMPEGELFAWCDREPTVRYPAVAAAITIGLGAREGEPPKWTNRSLRLLDQAPDRVAVLKQYVAQIELMCLGGANLALNTRLLEALRTHADPAVAEFVAQESARLGQIVDAQRRADKEAERERDESFE